MMSLFASWYYSGDMKEGTREEATSHSVGMSQFTLGRSFSVPPVPAVRAFASEAEMQTWFTGFLRSIEGRRILNGGGAAAFELKLVRCSGDRKKEREGQTTGHAGNPVAGNVKRRNARGICGVWGCSRRLACSKVEAGQEAALLRAGGWGLPLAYKISDSGAGYKPFDCFVMSGVRAYLVIGWSCSGTGAERPEACGSELSVVLEAKRLEHSVEGVSRLCGACGGCRALPVFRAYMVEIEAWRSWRAKRAGNEGLSEREAGEIGRRIV